MYKAAFTLQSLRINICCGHAELISVVIRIKRKNNWKRRMKEENIEGIKKIFPDLTLWNFV